VFIFIFHALVEVGPDVCVSCGLVFHHRRAAVAAQLLETFYFGGEIHGWGRNRVFFKTTFEVLSCIDIENRVMYCFVLVLLKKTILVLYCLENIFLKFLDFS